MQSLRQKLARRARATARQSSQIDAEATLRFNPERSTIRQQQRDLKSQMRGDVRAARGAARGIQAAARQAGPQIQKSYGDAASIVAGVNQLVGADLAQLSPQADRIKAAVQGDAAGTNRRLAESLASASGELASRSFDAEAGRVNAESNARARYESESAKLSDRLRNLGVEEGAFRQGRAGELAKDRADRRFTAGQNAKQRRNSRLTAGVDAQGHVIPGGKADKPGEGALPGGAKLATPAQHESFADKLAKVRAIAERQKKIGRGRAATARLLTEGRPETKLPERIDEAKYKKLRDAGATESEAKRQATVDPAATVPAIDAVSEKLASVALDIAYDGHVSRKNAKWLHANGYSLKELGVPSFTSTGGAAGARRRRRAAARQEKQTIQQATDVGRSVGVRR